MSSYVASPWVEYPLGGIDEDGLWGGKHGEGESVGEIYLECKMNKEKVKRKQLHNPLLSVIH